MRQYQEKCIKTVRRIQKLTEIENLIFKKFHHTFQRTPVKYACKK